MTEENLQARIPGNYLTALTDELGGTVLTMGNESELSVGYATLCQGILLPTERRRWEQAELRRQERLRSLR